MKVLSLPLISDTKLKFQWARVIYQKRAQQAEPLAQALPAPRMQQLSLYFEIKLAPSHSKHCTSLTARKD